jgi:hypothetical protein
MPPVHADAQKPGSPLHVGQSVIPCGQAPDALCAPEVVPQAIKTPAPNKMAPRQCG